VRRIAYLSIIFFFFFFVLVVYTAHIFSFSSQRRSSAVELGLLFFLAALSI